jgi:hypothetical protein
VRTQAALTLVGTERPIYHGQLKLGSEELILLASGIEGSAAAAANHPFFYEARLKASQATADPRARLQLLRSALEDTPARDDVRVPLFLTAASLRSDEFARGVIEPLLRQQFLNRLPAPVTAAEDEIIAYETDSTVGQNTPGSLPSMLKLAPAQQSQVALALALVLIRLDRLDEALPYLQIAQKLETNSTRRQQIDGKIADVRLQLRRRQLNDARQPILHEALEQDRVVRPKLLARTAPRAKAAAKKGVKQ